MVFAPSSTAAQAAKAPEVPAPITRTVGCGDVFLDDDLAACRLGNTGRCRLADRIAGFGCAGHSVDVPGLPAEEGFFHLFTDDRADSLGFAGNVHLYIGDAVSVKGHRDGDIADLSLYDGAVGAGRVFAFGRGLRRIAEAEKGNARCGGKAAFQKLTTGYFVSHDLSPFLFFGMEQSVFLLFVFYPIYKNRKRR